MDPPPSYSIATQFPPGGYVYPVTQIYYTATPLAGKNKQIPPNSAAATVVDISAPPVLREAKKAPPSEQQSGLECEIITWILVLVIIAAMWMTCFFASNFLQNDWLR